MTLLAPTARATWRAVCTLADLEVERGRAALIDGEQIALFLLHSDHLHSDHLHSGHLHRAKIHSADGAGGGVHAVQNLDPYSGAHVMSRGIVGTRGDAPTVASPMYKQVFDLRTGACLDPQGREPRALRVWPVAVDGGTVLVKWKAAR